MSLNYISVEKIRPDKYEAGVLFSHYFCLIQGLFAFEQFPFILPNARNSCDESCSDQSFLLSSEEKQSHTNRFPKQTKNALCEYNSSLYNEIKHSENITSYFKTLSFSYMRHSNTALQRHGTSISSAITFTHTGIILSPASSSHSTHNAGRYLQFSGQLPWLYCQHQALCHKQSMKSHRLFYTKSFPAKNEIYLIYF